MQYMNLLISNHILWGLGKSWNTVLQDYLFLIVNVSEYSIRDRLYGGHVAAS